MSASWPLAVSAIAWQLDHEAALLPAMAKAGVTGIEIAPTKLWPNWAGMHAQSAAEQRRRYADHGFSLPSMQAILFGIAGAAVFQGHGPQQVFLDHLARVCDIADVLGVKALVYGAPATRDPGPLSDADAWPIAVDFFRRAGEIAADRGMALCFEANPTAYNCRFGTTAVFAAKLVEAVDHPGFRQHLDAGQIGMMAENVTEAVHAAAPVLAHFHASEPNLGPFAEPVSPHAELAKALAAVDYQGWVSLEMRETASPVDDILTAIAAVKSAYPIKDKTP